MMLAPMEGVGHPTFRSLIAERGGVGRLCTEFVRIGRAPLNPELLRAAVVKHPGVPLSVQVMGNEADKMAEAAAAVADAGADVVDINLGCPSPTVVRKGVGSAMLKDPELLYRVLSSMRAAVPGLLSAKIRAGFDEADHVVLIGRTVEAAGADLIVVHPRRRADFYDGVADWRIIATLRASLSIPVVGNGDSWYAADALRMQAETGCHGVMLGRPALRNPWIFAQVDALRRGVVPHRPNGEEAVAFFVDVVGRYRVAFGRDGGGLERALTGKLKEWMRFFCRAVPDGGVLRRELLHCADTDAMLRLLEARIGAWPAEGLDLGPHGELGLERSGSAIQKVAAAASPAGWPPPH